MASDPLNLLQNVARSNRKLPGGECWLTEVAEIRTGHFESRHFWNLEKMRSGRQRENRFSASSLTEFIRSASGDKPAAGLSPMVGRIAN